MRLSYDCFSKLENQRARDRMRLVDGATIAKVGFKPIFWTVPFMIRILNRVDDVLENNPSEALALATPLPILAEKIPVRLESHCYRDEDERSDFILLAKATLSSALLAAGRAEDAVRMINEALRASGAGTSQFARAEVLRRAAYIALETGKNSEALMLAEKAAEYFRAESAHEQLALCCIYIGQALDLRNGSGEGIGQYAQALYYGTQTRTKRAERVLVAAAGSLARDAVLTSAFPSDAMQWVLAAREAMKGRPASIPKLKIRWVEALAAYRHGAGRYAATHLESVRNQLLKLKAFGDAATCTADLIAVVSDYEPEALGSVLDRSMKELRRSTPEWATTLVETWAERPSDVRPLRKLSSVDPARISQQA